MYSHFTTQSVRDLAWVISSPPLMQGKYFLDDKFFNDEYEKAKNWLSTLDKNPKELEEFLQNQKRQALGSYFEYLIHFWLAHRENTKIIAHNLQVNNNERTIGEFDFILEIDSKPIHLEVSVKYYLGIKNISDWPNWVGPRAKDNLDIKLSKLLDKQLPLPKSSNGAEALSQINISNPQSLALVKGYFFSHISSSNPLWPQNANPNHNKGFWCTLSEFKNMQLEESNWHILHKPDWFAPQTKTVSFAKPEFHTHLDKVFEQNPKPLLVSNHINYRGFIVTDGWEEEYLNMFS